MIEWIAGGCLISLVYIWIRTNDKNIDKLNKIFETNNLKAGDQIPMLSKKRGNVYIFRMPVGLAFEHIKDKEYVFQDAFPDKAVSISYNRALRILITDPIPDRVDMPELDVKGWMLPLGQSLEKIIYHDFAKYPHMLVSGMTRYGKSVLLGLMITLLLKSKPNNIRLVLIDLKGGLELNPFSKLKQSYGFAKNSDEALKLLEEIKKQIEDRQEIFLSKGYKKIEEAKGFDRVFIVIDEASQLVSKGVTGSEGKKLRKCERLLSYCAQIGAGMGFHIIYATQYPTKDTLPQQVKQNCDATISFRLRNSTASRVVFDEADKAENLPLIRGRAIYRTDRDIELQVFYMDDKTINEVIEENRKENIDESPDIKGSKAGEDTVIFR